MKIKTFIILLFFNFTLSQNNLTIYYKVNIEDEKDLFSSNAVLRKYFEKAIANSNLLEFKLICKEDSSKFYDSSSLLDLDFSQKQTLLSFSSYHGEVYQKRDSLFCNSKLLGNNIFLKKVIKLDWTLQNETKEINGFLCYKATSINKIVYGEKIFNHPITAWYCPKIPYRFGPNGYSGLPGLILELQVRNVVYGASKIELNTTETFKIETNKMKILNKKEYEEALNKLNDF
jgi:GLPGLI family protein